MGGLAWATRGYAASEQEVPAPSPVRPPSDALPRPNGHRSRLLDPCGQTVTASTPTENCSRPQINLRALWSSTLLVISFVIGLASTTKAEETAQVKCPKGGVPIYWNKTNWCAASGTTIPLQGPISIASVKPSIVITSNWREGAPGDSLTISSIDGAISAEIGFSEGRPNKERFKVYAERCFGEVRNFSGNTASFTFKTWYRNGGRMADGTCTGDAPTEWEAWEHGKAAAHNDTNQDAVRAFCTAANEMLRTIRMLASGGGLQ